MNILSRLKSITRAENSSEDISLMRASGLFDEAWYCIQVSGIDWTKVNPLFHYLHEGAAQGYDPGPRFSSTWYLSTYPDVKDAGMNPLVHYLRAGRAEGRQPQPESVQRLLSRTPASAPGRAKIFCIGFNKTGTTSLERLLKDFGYRLGDQAESEMLLRDWAVRDFRALLRHCESADAFQDVPFSLDFTYQALDQGFPGSKFILTVRSSADEWYQSLVRFHSQTLQLDHVPPTADEVKPFDYRYPGYLWEYHQYVFGATESTLYDETIYKSQYEEHNRKALEYFKLRPDDFLVLNLSNPDAIRSLCLFLGIEYTGQVMPHLNRSAP